MESLLSKTALTPDKERKKAGGGRQKKFLDCKVKFQEIFGQAKGVSSREGLCLLGMDLNQHLLSVQPLTVGSISCRMYHSLFTCSWILSPVALFLVFGHHK